MADFSKLVEQFRSRYSFCTEFNYETKWTVTLTEDKRSTKKMHLNFHLAKAFLESTSNKGGDGLVFVMIQRNDDADLLCILSPKNLQADVDMDFDVDEEVTFFIKGNGTVRLTGFDVPDHSHHDHVYDPDYWYKAVLDSYEEFKRSEKGNDVSGTESLTGLDAVTNSHHDHGYASDDWVMAAFDFDGKLKRSEEGNDVSVVGSNLLPFMDDNGVCQGSSISECLYLVKDLRAEIADKDTEDEGCVTFSSEKECESNTSP